MRNSDVVALARPVDDVALEPVRPLLRIRRDDDLDGSETPEGVFDRLQRICVAHLARCLDAPLGEAPDGDREPLLGLGGGAVDSET